jgi:Flp pilus assembly protein TadB
MKQFFFLLTLILGFRFSAQAADVATSNYGTNTITIGNTTREASTKKVATPKKNVFAKIGQWFKKAVKQDILFYVYVLFYVLSLLAPVSIVLGLLSGFLPLVIGGLIVILVGWLIVLLLHLCQKRK